MKAKINCIIIVCVFFFIFNSNLFAKSFTVDNMARFQLALEESQSNNEPNYIYLEPNIYSGSSFVYSSENTNDLTIKPANDYTSSNVVIDAEGAKCPLSISTNGIVRISNITIINGTSSLGGLYIKTSGNIELLNCKINNNSNGGGVRLDTTGNVTIKDCNIQNNSSSTNGGGVYVKANNAIIENNLISDNFGKYGGGIYIDSSNDTLFNNNYVKSNTINGRCGPDREDISTPIGGGGIYVKSITLTLINNLILNNTVSTSTSGLGGGLYTYCSGTTLVSENVISKNIVKNSNSRYGSFGAGIYSTLNGGKYILKNNTISDNVGSMSSSYGMGVSFDYYSLDKDLLIVNNIIWGNKNTWTGKADDLYIYKAHPKVKVWHNIYDVIRVFKTDYSISPLSTIQSNPLFINSQMNDYNISKNSPAIDKGTTEIIEASVKDIIGNKRINGNTIDIGAYEYSNKITSPIFIQSDLNFVPLYISITCETPDVQIRYTTDNTIPDMTSLLYTEPLYLTIATIVTAKAFKDGMDESDAVSMTYISKETNYLTDTDNDGIIDQLDECPNTISSKAVYSNGCIAYDIYEQIKNLTDKNNTLIHRFDIGKDNKKGLQEAIDALKVVAGINSNDLQLYSAKGMYLYNSETKILMLNIQNSTFPESSYYYNGILQYEVISISQSSISLTYNNSNQIIWERDEGEGIIGEWSYAYNQYKYYIILANDNSLQIYVQWY